jgi:hypothetical protein
MRFKKIKEGYWKSENIIDDWDECLQLAEDLRNRYPNSKITRKIGDVDFLSKLTGIYRIPPLFGKEDWIITILFSNEADEVEFIMREI